MDALIDAFPINQNSRKKLIYLVLQCGRPMLENQVLSMH
jgi:hypothetical protein